MLFKHQIRWKKYIRKPPTFARYFEPTSLLRSYFKQRCWAHSQTYCNCLHRIFRMLCLIHFFSRSMRTNLLLQNWDVGRLPIKMLTIAYTQEDCIGRWLYCTDCSAHCTKYACAPLNETFRRAIMQLKKNVHANSG